MSWSPHGAGCRQCERWSFAVYFDDMKFRAVSGDRIHHVRSFLRGLLVAEPPRDCRVALRPEVRAGCPAFPVERQVFDGLAVAAQCGDGRSR